MNNEKMENSIDFQDDLEELLTDYYIDPDAKTAMLDALYRLEAVEPLLDKPDQQAAPFMNFYRKALENLRMAVDACPEK